MSPKSNAFRFYRCYTTLLYQRIRILPVLVGTRQNAVLNPPRHSATFYGTPRNRRIDGTLPADFFSAPRPHFSRFPTLRVRCDVIIINTLSLLV